MRTLFRWPPATQLVRPITKTKLALASKPTAKTKRLLKEHVDSITWTRLLNSKTVSLTATEAVKEINVFSLKLRTAECPDAMLLYIDSCIAKPIIFELTYANKVQMAATYKRPSRAKPGELVTYDYYRSEWIDQGQANAVGFRQNLPHALDLGQLYAALLEQLLPVTARQSEALDDLFERAATLTKLERELARVKARRAKEKQFNRKIELNAEVVRLEGEVTVLR